LQFNCGFSVVVIVVVIINLIPVTDLADFIRVNAAAVDDRAERCSEVSAGVVVDDGIDARVGVGQTVPDDIQSRVDRTVCRDVAE